MNKLVKIFSYIVLLSILIVSVIKVSNQNLPEESDKIVHFIMYFFCAGIFYFLKIKYYVLFAILYGFLIEIIQYFIPWRSFSLGDILANSLGAIAFYFSLKFYFNKKFNYNKN